MKNLITPVRSACCALAIAATFSAPAVAEDAQVVGASFVGETDGEVRVNMSGKLRMLSQRIPAAACNAQAGVSPEISASVVDGALAEFKAILAALEHGDQEMGVLTEETRVRTLRVIQEIHNRFEPIQAALDADAGSDLSNQLVAIAAEHNMNVLDAAKLLVTEISGQYASRVSLLQSDAMTIDIAGRQRMLTQKTSKEICFIMSGVEVEASRAALAGTVQTFEASLIALRDGMKDVGINPPPNDEIAAGLEGVQLNWGMVRPAIAKVLAGEDITMEERAIVF